MRLADVPLMLRTCEFCGRSYPVEKRQGRPPVTCSPECRKARGREVKALGRKARQDTGVWDLTRGERHSTDATEESAEALDAVLSGSDDLAAGYSTASAHVPQTTDSGVYVRDSEGRVVTRFRNWFGEANAADASEESVTPGLRVIGQADLPWDWQERADQGESVADMRMSTWLGVDLSAV